MKTGDLHVLVMDREETNSSQDHFQTSAVFSVLLLSNIALQRTLSEVEGFSIHSLNRHTAIPPVK